MVRATRDTTGRKNNPTGSPSAPCPARDPNYEVGTRTIRTTRLKRVGAAHERRKFRILLAIKMKARTVVGREDEGPLCDPGSELLLGGSARVVRG